MIDSLVMKKRVFIQNKLWRDHTPKMLEQTGSVIHTKYLDDNAFNHHLRLKLREEADEVISAESQQELMNELADVLEVIDALCALHEMSQSDIVAIQAKKRAERGGFSGRMFVTTAEHFDGSAGANYCLAQPDKYPEAD